MALWTDPSHDANTDIAVFIGEGQDQPLGLSIVLLADWANNIPLSARNIDWSRIVAVEIDEPYTSVDGYLVDPDCNDALPAALFTAIAPIDTALEHRAAELEALNPKARFWVNFTSNEGSWMGNCVTLQVFNRAYIDVISEDYYSIGSVGVNSFYTIVASYPAKPDQQLALIPGVFSAPKDQAQWLQTYFDYANNLNQTCNLPLGSRGFTGIYDGCPVWVVMGWESAVFTDASNTTYVGMLDPRSATVAAIWRAELALPLAPALAHQLTPGQLVQTIVFPLLLRH